MTDVHALIAAAKPAETTVPICLRGELVAQLEDLEREYEKARRQPSTRGKEDPDPQTEFVEQARALQAEMEQGTVVFRLRKLPPAKYRALVAAHPPRRDEEDQLDQGDVNLGFNRDTFLPELIRLSTYEPQLSDAEWRRLLGDSETEAARLAEAGEDAEEGVLSFHQTTELAGAAYAVNEREVRVPFSLADLLMKQSSVGE
jgi:hypothetical protein